MPPLRERREDIPLLAEWFLDKFAAANSRAARGFTPECMDLFKRYPWPGNVRELEHAVERGVILMHGEYLDVPVLPTALQRWAEQQTGLPPEPEAPATLKDAERALILKTLEETGGNRSEAAKYLGIARKTLYRNMERLGMSPEES